MNQKERSTVKYVFNFIYGLIFAVVMFLILIIITIVYSPVALLLWFVTRKSFLESWGGIQKGWKIILDVLSEIETGLELRVHIKKIILGEELYKKD